jgi:hypothetical protein
MHTARECAMSWWRHFDSLMSIGRSLGWCYSETVHRFAVAATSMSSVLRPLQLKRTASEHDATLALHFRQSPNELRFMFTEHVSALAWSYRRLHLE